MVYLNHLFFFYVLFFVCIAILTSASFGVNFASMLSLSPVFIATIATIATMEFKSRLNSRFPITMFSENVPFAKTFFASLYIKMHHDAF